MKPKTTRSRTGCYTCRRRKKKCDESSYPICNNCTSKHVECVWPKVTQELYEKLRQVKYIDTGGSHKPDSTITPLIRQDPSSSKFMEINQDEASTVDASPFDQYLQSPYSDFTDNSETNKTINPPTLSKPNTIISKKSSHILNMIAMQQDCVESEEDDPDTTQQTLAGPTMKYPLIANNEYGNNALPTILTASIPISTISSTKSIKNKALHSAIALMESPRLETSDAPPPVFNLDFSRLSSPEV